MTGVRLELEGSEAALAALGAAAARLDDPMPLYDEIGSMLVVSTQNRFEREEAPDGTPWPMSIRVLTEGGKTLSDTRRLVNSMTHEASNEGVAVGTNVIYAAPHQMGATIKAKTAKGLRFQVAGGWVNKQSVDIPQRAFLGLDADDEKVIGDIAGDYLGDPLGGVDVDR
ncbi:phage virion morphogenesis (putative tail completion) protein [Hoeflea phototrophica DFL-43]|jgi:phage virion morphogenesis protein|uniref:Phage virion morphogenesis (Putative tail completion) protein n=1 Tax=Hoeflea phototrophica (strain DSM 17068 / NCIMB 14078 / DFL-43) TaxID=411684 RepID=A9D2Y2_HOEPD|nr:phage virion morphogenesis protein [Hoeflea phototrophica]EDQ34295.1 phage virion morphogenesis (putative tail completion) protein [Hoeflea phototrophica DFL-43]